MKKLYLLTLACLIYGNISAQMFIDFRFDGNDMNASSLSIDSSNTTNCWQIGEPLKPGFDSAYSSPNVIGTGLVDQYPTSDTSVFIVTIYENGGYVDKDLVSVQGYIWANTDSLNDYATIETSLDNGQTWINLMNDPDYGDDIGIFNSPVLTGSSNGWKYFEIYLTELGDYFDIYWGDPILYRFSYISDSNQDSLPGIMFDNLSFGNYSEGINEQSKNTFESIAFPNPAKNNINIDYSLNTGAHAMIRLMDVTGKILHVEKSKSAQNNIDVTNYAKGLYYYTIQSGKDVSHGRFLVE